VIFTVLVILNAIGIGEGLLASIILYIATLYLIINLVVAVAYLVKLNRWVAENPGKEVMKRLNARMPFSLASWSTLQSLSSQISSQHLWHHPHILL